MDRLVTETQAEWAESQTAPPPGGQPSEVLIRRSRGWPSLRLRELAAYRELLYFLVWRDVKVRYKQTALGVAWAILQPLLTVFVFTLFFHRVAGITTGDIPYALFALSGMVPWLFFANGVTVASTSVVTNVNLVTKVYFPRLVIPIAAVLSNLPDIAIGFGLLLVVMAFYGTAPTSRDPRRTARALACVRHQFGCLAVVVGADRRVQGCPLHRAASGPGLDARLAGCVRAVFGALEVEADPGPQPHDGSAGAFPMGCRSVPQRRRRRQS